MDLSAVDYQKLVEALLDLEQELKRLGDVVVDTRDGLYAMHEQAIDPTFPDQSAYNKALEAYNAKKRIVEALDSIARYKLSLRQSQAA